MSSKERFLTAMLNGVPDRVPVAPDMSNYIPCKRTGLPFWEIYFEQNVPLWRAYLDAADYFGIDAWIAASLDAPIVQYPEADIETSSRCCLDKDRDAMVRRTTIRTPRGDLNTEEVCFRYDPPTMTVKPIKNLQADWESFKYTQLEPIGINEDMVREVRSECDKRDQAFGVTWTYPGFHMWNLFVQGGVEALTFAEFDNPEILQEWFELDLAIGTKVMELMLQAKPDYILLGGSGTLTLSSPELAQKYAIPALAKWTKMARQANVATMLHSCGKSRQLVDMLVEHTDLNCINPLEIPPMGDVNLAEVKQKRGEQISLMGNLHTTNVMLEGTPEQVKLASKEAIQAAGQNGGFILSTGDQCGRETPDENIFAMLEAANEDGVYNQSTGKLK